MYAKARLILASFGILFLTLAPVKLYSQPFYVTAILDGERVVLSNGDRVKLIGVDALEKFGQPEAIREAARLGVNPESVKIKGGIQAYYLGLLVESKRVLVSYVEMEKPAASENQDFRPAYLSVLTEQGNIDFVLNRKMIQDGYAAVDAKYPFYYMDDFLQLQEEAMEFRRGMWAYYDRTGKPLVPGTVLPSKSADLSSECSKYEFCVWVSGQNTSVGYWRSAGGGKCPCEQ